MAMGIPGPLVQWKFSRLPVRDGEAVGPSRPGHRAGALYIGFPGVWKLEGSYWKVSRSFKTLPESFHKRPESFQTLPESFQTLLESFQKLPEALMYSKHSVFENRSLTNHSSTVHQPFIRSSTVRQPFINHSSTIHQSFCQFLETFRVLPSGFRVKGGCRGFPYRGDRDHRPKVPPPFDYGFNDRHAVLPSGTWRDWLGLW